MTGARRHTDPAQRVAEHIRELQPYVPGKPTWEVEQELGLTEVFKLASNENPLGPSPRALDAIRDELATLNRYPDGDSSRLRGALAQRLSVAPQQLIFGNGSNEILTLIGRILLRPGDESVMSEGAFVVYGLATQSSGAVRVATPATGFGHDLEAIAGAIRPSTRAVFLANPNNPTGTMFGRRDWEKFVARVPEDVVIVYDAAYAEYVVDPEYPDPLAIRGDHPQLVVLRTFSKIHGLAGLRIGYGVGPQWLVDLVERVRDPFNVNHLAQVAACAALEDDEHLQRSREINRQGMRFLERVCRALGLEFVPSQGNFLLIEVGLGQEAFEALQRAGVIVRPVTGYGFPRHIRVTIGLPDENTAFAQALAAILGHSGAATALMTQPPLEDGAAR